MSKDVRTLLHDLDADPADYAEFLDPADGTVEVALGMHPEYTGRRLGRAFVEVGLEFGRERYDPERFELAVAAFDDRAVSVYGSLGFERLETYTQSTNGRGHEFLRMGREA